MASKAQASRVNGQVIFDRYSIGTSTNRDAVVYANSRSLLLSQVERFCDDYNAEVDRYIRKGKAIPPDAFVSYEKVKWSDTLKRHLGSV
jgi:predicted helicase